jgi:hypothetical protein
MSTVLAKLGLDRASIIAMTGSKPPPVAVDVVRNASPLAQGPQKHHGNKPVLPRHTTPATLPKYGDTREDGYRFLSGFRQLGKDGQVYWCERWVNPALFETQAQYGKPPDAKKPHGTHQIHKSRDTLPQFGATRDDGYRFAQGTRWTTVSGEVHWREMWVSPANWEKRYAHRKPRKRS